MIKTYVEKDPTAFYSYEEFETGVETMSQFCTMRSESISMQLVNGETANDRSYVDASALTLSDMGSMGGKGGFGGMPDMDERGSFGDRDVSERDKSDKSGFQSMPGANRNFDPSNLPEGFERSQVPGDFNFNMNDMGNAASSSTNWIWVVVSVLILGVGLLIAKLYMR